MARMMRSVWVSRGRSKCECTDTTTTSSAAKALSGKSRAPVLENIHFDAFEDGDPLEPGVEPIDFLGLLQQASGIEAVDHGDPAAVIGQGDILIAHRPRSLCHLFNACRAVRPRRVDMEVAADVRQRHEVRHLMGLARAISPRSSRNSGGTKESPSFW